MSRYSPTVLPQRGPSFFEEVGQGLSGAADALDARRVRKRQEHQDTEAEEDRTRRMGHEDEQWGRDRDQAGRQKLLDAIALAQTGYHEGAPPAEDDASAAAALDTRRSRGNMLPGEGGYTAPPQTSAPDQRGNVTAMGVGATGDAAAMLEARRSVPGYGNATPGGYNGEPEPAAAPPPSPMKLAAQRYYQVPGQAGYIDLSQTPDARKAAADEATDTRQHGFRMGELGQEHEYRGQEEGVRYGHEESVHQMDQEGDRARDQSTTDRELAVQRLRNSGDLATERLRNRASTRTDDRKATAEEAEGSAFLNTFGAKGKDDPLIATFGKAFQGVRQAHPDWTPGRAAYHAKAALQDARPDLFPSKPAAETPWERLLREGAPAGAPGGQPADTTGVHPAKRRLTPEESARARSDPGFREFLSAKGYKEGDY